LEEEGVVIMDKDIRSVLENVNIRNQFKDTTRDLFDDAEYEAVSEEEKEKIDERAVVTFDNKSYPREGWAVIMAGGPGSGKGFSLGNQVLIDGKVVDVDRLKELYSLWYKANRDKAAMNNPEFAPQNGREYDFKNPDDVFSLHKLIKAKGWKSDVYSNFFNANERLENIIFDITGKTLSSLKTYASMCKENFGYKTSLVWVVTNRMWAMFRNMNRDRVVPEDVFHEIHNLLKDSVFNFLDLKDAPAILDEAWVVFSGDAGKFKGENPVDSARDLQGTVYKIEQKGGKFVIPDKLKKKIIMHLGPNEPNPGNPKRYKEFDNVKGDVEDFGDGDEIDMMNHDLTDM
jgi:hypothetical protein